MRAIVMQWSISLVLLSSMLAHAVTPQEQYRKAISLLLAGNHSQSDRGDAFSLLRLAADSGYSPAQAALGSAYEQGFVVAQDSQQAVAWYKKAADQGDWIAQFSLGRIYFSGTGVARDTAAAKRWLEPAAADSRASGAAFYLGLLFDDGQGTATNYGEAAKWYRQSAERGNPFAMEKLAALLLEGYGSDPGPGSREEAYVFLLTASELGNHQVDKQLQSMESDLGKNGADSARAKALDFRDQVDRYARAQCNGWDGQFSSAPTPPPLDLQATCEQ